ncbi:MAG TPA: hypothetical protein ENK59_09415 [Thioploca sp.]|nr:hypothetical protein [Thioploca sp.]
MNRFLTIILLISLPMQSCSAITALLCQDDFSTVKQLSHSNYHASQQSKQISLDCDDCVSCHSVINYNIFSGNSLPVISLVAISPNFYPPHFYHFIPELLQHPPKIS